MTTSQGTTNLCESTVDKEIDFYTLKYMGSHARHLAHEALLKAFRESGLTRAVLAKRLKWDRSRVSRLINTPANITVETFGELLFAINGSSPDFQCKNLLDEKPSNYYISKMTKMHSSLSFRMGTGTATSETLKQTKTYKAFNSRVREDA